MVFKDIKSYGSTYNEWRRQHRFKKMIAKAGRPPGDTCDVCRHKYGDAEVPCFDHNHRTGAFRGWLCRKCNAALGQANDSPAVLDKLAAYLRERGFAGAETD